MRLSWLFEVWLKSNLKDVSIIFQNGWDLMWLHITSGEVDVTYSCLLNNEYGLLWHKNVIPSVDSQVVLVNMLIICSNLLRNFVSNVIWSSRDGTSIILSDDVGQLYILSTGQVESQKDYKYDQVFYYDQQFLVYLLIYLVIGAVMLFSTVLFRGLSPSYSRYTWKCPWSGWLLLLTTTLCDG